MWVILILALIALVGAGYGFISLASLQQADPGKDRAMSALMVGIIVLAFVAGSLAEKVLP
jgi:hypothetical protein